jgi:hypothetical protein
VPVALLLEHRRALCLRVVRLRPEPTHEGDASPAAHGTQLHSLVGWRSTGPIPMRAYHFPRRPALHALCLARPLPAAPPAAARARLPHRWSLRLRSFATSSCSLPTITTADAANARPKHAKYATRRSPVLHGRTGGSSPSDRTSQRTHAPFTHTHTRTHARTHARTHPPTNAVRARAHTRRRGRVHGNASVRQQNHRYARKQAPGVCLDLQERQEIGDNIEGLEPDLGLHSRAARLLARSQAVAT